MVKEIYIGTRADFNTMEKLIKKPLRRLNQGLAESLRTAALSKGIKKTEQKKRLEFYSVSEIDLKQLNDKATPLVKVDKNKMVSSLTKVNGKYTQRMDYKTAEKYKKELATAMSKCIEIVGADKNTRNKARTFTGKNPYKVGDWLLKHCYGGKSVIRIWKVTPKGYYYETPVLLDENNNQIKVNNLQYAKANYKGVHGVELHFDADWTIPYKGNEDRMSFRKCNTIVRLGWSDARMLKEYGVDCILTKQKEQGYNYNRRID
jgi:hypothetical protein